MILNFVNFGYFKDGLDIYINNTKYKTCDNVLKIDIPSGGYVIKVCYKTNLLKTFVVYLKCNNTYYLYNDEPVNGNRPNRLKFLLTDYHYPNLLIERGNLTLWNMM